MESLRDDLDDLRARLEEMRASAKRLPHREKYLLLVIAFLERVLAAHEQLADDVERELAPKQTE
jgi:hypothetical protein